MKPVLIFSIVLVTAFTILAQNTNSSTNVRPRTANANQSPTPAQTATPIRKRLPATPTQKPTPTPPAASTHPERAVISGTQAPGSAAVLAAFNQLLDGIRKADVKAVSSVYWNSPRLVLFNNNGTVTKGWEQMHKNRESSYRDVGDVKLDVRDVSVMMLGRDGAMVSCLWTQSQTYKGTPESATGRMTLVFKLIGKDWKAIHLHTSPDKEDPSRVLPSEHTPTPIPTPTPTPSP